MGNGAKLRLSWVMPPAIASRERWYSSADFGKRFLNESSMVDGAVVAIVPMRITARSFRTRVWRLNGFERVLWPKPNLFREVASIADHDGAGAAVVIWPELQGGALEPYRDKCAVILDAQRQPVLVEGRRVRGVEVAH